MHVLIVHPSPPEDVLDALVCTGNRVVVVGADGDRDGVAFVPADVNDMEALARAVLAIHERDPFSVVLPTWEGTCEQVSRLAVRLGLAGNPHEAVQRARNKHLSFERLVEHGVGIPESRLVQSADEGINVIRCSFGYPAIVKLPSSTNSQSVTLVTCDQDVRVAAETIKHLYERKGRLRAMIGSADSVPTMLVQAYVEGPELNIDLMYTADDHVVMGVFEKAPMVGPAFGEIYSVFPVSLEAGALEECTQAALMAVRALGATVGAAHVELRYGTAGPVVIDIGLRPGGAYTARAIEALQGSNVYVALVDLLSGGNLPDMHDPQGACLYGGVLIEQAGTVAAVEGLGVLEHTPGILDYQVLVGPGDAVEPLPASANYHIAHFIMQGNCREVLLDRAARIRSAIHCRMREAS